MKKMLGSIALAALLAVSCSPKAIVADTPTPPAETAAAPAAPAAAAPSIEGIPAGDYKLDPEHSTFFFRVNHLSFSKFTLWYDTFSADLKLDPANPSAAVMNATIDPASLTVHAPSKGFLDHLKSADYLDAAGFPSITFKSTQIKLTGPNTRRRHRRPVHAARHHQAAHPADDLQWRLCRPRLRAEGPHRLLRARHIQALRLRHRRRRAPARQHDGRVRRSRSHPRNRMARPPVEGRSPAAPPPN